MNPSDASKGGLALAEQISSAYADNPKVRAILVGGSVARGWADQYSDLEIGVFWDELPSDDERHHAIQTLSGDLWSFHSATNNPDWLASEHYGLGEVVIENERIVGHQMIDAKHLTVAALERCLSQVVEGYDTTADKLVLVSAIQDGIALRGAAILEAWRAKAASFPAELAVKVVQEHLWFGPWFYPEAYLERGDDLVLHQHFVRAEQELLQVSLGLNRRYLPSREFKWLDQVCASLLIAPANLAERMRQVLRGEPADSWLQLKSLMADAIDLVEKYLPQVNTLVVFQSDHVVTTQWARERWRIGTNPIHSDQPPYTLMTRVETTLR